MQLSKKYRIQTPLLCLKNGILFFHLMSPKFTLRELLILWIFYFHKVYITAAKHLYSYKFLVQKYV